MRFVRKRETLNHMQSDLREIFSEIRHFSTAKKFGLGLFALADLSLISRMTFDLTVRRLLPKLSQELLRGVISAQPCSNKIPCSEGASRIECVIDSLYVYISLAT